MVQGPPPRLLMIHIPALTSGAEDYAAFREERGYQVELLGTDAAGLMHLTCEGACSWNEFARQIWDTLVIATPLGEATVDDFPVPFQRPTYSVLANTRLAATGLSPMPHWREALADFDGAVCRSGVKLTADVLQGNRRLRAVVRAGVGTDNIDKIAATRQGIVVMNTPTGNVITTAEHTIAMILALSRNIPRGTPFELCGAGNDNDAGNNVTFLWEEFDLGPAAAMSRTQ